VNIFEVRKLFKAKKIKAVGPRQSRLDYIVRKAKELIPGEYTAKGYSFRVERDGKVKIEHDGKWLTLDEYKAYRTKSESPLS
jgi:hypothetical protein